MLRKALPHASRVWKHLARPVSRPKISPIVMGRVDDDDGGTRAVHTLVAGMGRAASLVVLLHGRVGRRPVVGQEQARAGV